MLEARKTPPIVRARFAAASDDRLAKRAALGDACAFEAIFQAEIRERGKTFAAISPLPAIAMAGLLQTTLGGAGAAAGAGGAGVGVGLATGSLGASAPVKSAAGLLAVVAIGTAAVDHKAVFHGSRHRGGGDDLATVASHVADLSSTLSNQGTHWRRGTAALAEKAKKAKGKAKAKAKPKAPERPQAVEETELPLGPGANAALAGQAALAGTKAAGRALGAVAAKAKGPMFVGAGTVAGVAGGLAVVRRRNGRAPQGTLEVDRVVAAARRAGSFGEELGPHGEPARAGERKLEAEVKRGRRGPTNARHRVRSGG